MWDEGKEGGCGGLVATVVRAVPAAGALMVILMGGGGQRWCRFGCDEQNTLSLLFVGKNMLRVTTVISQGVRICACPVLLWMHVFVCVRCPIYSEVQRFFLHVPVCFVLDASSAGVMKKEEGHTTGDFVCFTSPSFYCVLASLLDSKITQTSLSIVDRELEPVPEGIIHHYQGSVLYQLTRTGTPSGRCVFLFCLHLCLM